MYGLYRPGCEVGAEDMVGCVAEGLVFGLRTNFFFVVLLAEEQSVHLVSADLYKGVEGGTGMW